MFPNFYDPSYIRMFPLHTLGSQLKGNFYDPSYIRMFPLHTLGSQLKGNFSIHCSVAIICFVQ